MILRSIPKLVEKFISDNAPAILTGVGVVGTGTTAYLAARGAYQAANTLDEESNRRVAAGESYLDLNTQDKAKLTWKLYLPAVGSGVATITCIICAQKMNAKRAAALAAAYSLSESRFKEYKDKVTEKFGPSKEQNVRDEVAQEQVTKSSDRSSEVIISNETDVLFYDTISGRYFQSNMEKVRRAENDINQEIVYDFCASLGQFHEKLGLDPGRFGDEVGWNAENMLELAFSGTLTKDNRPCIAITYSYEPIRGFTKRVGSKHPDEEED